MAQVVKNESFAIMLIVVAASSYGLYPSFTKLSYAAGVNQSYIIVFSTFIRALALSAFAFFFQKHSLRSLFPLRPAVLFAALLQALSIIGILGSLLYIPAPVMITIVFSHTFMLLLYSGYRGIEQLTPAVIASTLLALLGVGLVVDVFSESAELEVFGLSLAFMGALATAGRFFLFGQLAKAIPSVIVGGSTLFFAFFFLLPIFYFQPPAPPMTLPAHGFVWASALTLSFGSLLTFYALSIVSAFRISFILKIEPIFTSLFAVLLLGEVLSLTRYIGMALVLLSLFFYEFYRRVANSS